MKNNHIVLLSGEENDLVKLRKVCQEVVYTGAFGSSPTVLSLDVALVSYRMNVIVRVRRTSQVDVTSKSSKDSRSVYGF